MPASVADAGAFGAETGRANLAGESYYKVEVDGLGQFGADLFAGLGGGGVGSESVAGNEGGQGDGDNRETGFHDSFLGGG